MYTPADPANYCSVERDLTVTVQSESAPEAPGTSGGSGGDTENSGGDTGDSSGDTSGSGEGTGGSGGGSGSSGGGSAGSNGSAASSGSVSTEQSGGSASVTTIAPASTVVDGKIDFLLVANLSRLGRDVGKMDAYLRWLEDWFVEVVCADGTVP